MSKSFIDFVLLKITIILRFELQLLKQTYKEKTRMNNKHERSAWIEGYFNILTRYSYQINSLIFTLLLISIISIFSGYSFYINKLCKRDAITEAISYSSPFLADYLLLLTIIGVTLLFWLSRLIKYLKNILIETFNYPSQERNQEDFIIPSLFYILLPDESFKNQKIYYYFEIILLIFICSIIRLTCSNLMDLYITHSKHTETHTNYNYFQIFGSSIIYLFFIFFSLYLFDRIKHNLIDIRNLIILIRWERTSFFPMLYEIFEEQGIYLKQYQNRMEYRKVGGGKVHEFCINVNVYNPLKRDIRFIHSKINLTQSLFKFNRNNRDVKIQREFTKDKYLERILTIEEERMRDFFRIILSDRNYEKGLYFSFTNAISEKVHSAINEMSNSRLHYKKVIDTCRTLIEESNLKEALHLLDQFLEEEGNEYTNEVKLNLRRYNKLLTDYRKGVIPRAQFDVELTIIANNILEILSIIEIV